MSLPKVSSSLFHLICISYITFSCHGFISTFFYIHLGTNNCAEVKTTGNGGKYGAHSLYYIVYYYIYISGREKQKEGKNVNFNKLVCLMFSFFLLNSMIDRHGWPETFIVFSHLWEHCRGLRIFTCLADSVEVGFRMERKNDMENLTESNSCL